MDQQLQAYEQSVTYAPVAIACFDAVLGLLRPRPRSMTDLGCGDGSVVSHAVFDLRIPGIGYDINLPEEEKPIGLIGHLYRADLSRLFIPPEPRDLVICWEVAEHLPSQAADMLCWLIAQSITVDGHLVFTAALTGQGGSGHLNEQPQKYWREKIIAQGLLFMSDLTEAVKLAWTPICQACWWYPQNVQVFKRVS